MMSDPINTDENSFEEYKKYLEDSIGVLNLNPPNKPMNAYMRYFFERSCEQRSKGNKEWKKMTQTISEEWKKIMGNRKQYYEKMYEIRMRERSEIYEQYERIIKKKKPASAWSRYFKKRYSIYAKEHPDYSAKQITKLVSSDWRVIPQKQKAKLQKEYQEEKVAFETKQDDTESMQLYKERVDKYNQQLNEQKQKIMKKYGVSKQALQRQKLLKDKQQKQRKALQSVQRRRMKNQKRRKERQERNRKEKEDRQKLRKEKAELQEKERKALHQEKTKAKLAEKAAKAELSHPAPTKFEQTKQVTTPPRRGPSKAASNTMKPTIQSKKVTAAPKKAAMPKKTKKILKPAKKRVAEKAPVKKEASTPRGMKQQTPVTSKKVVKAGKPAKQAVKPAAKKTNARRGKK